MKLCWPDGLPRRTRIATVIILSDLSPADWTTGSFVSPLFIQPITGSEYEDYTSFLSRFRREEVGLHKFYLINPYIGHKPLLSRMNIVVSAIKHLFKILILHWNRLLSIKLISLHAFGLQAFRPTAHILLHFTIYVSPWLTISQYRLAFPFLRVLLWVLTS